MTSIRLTHAIEVKALQDLIISQAQAIYGRQYQRNTFSVLLSHRDNDCIAQLIVYTIPDSFYKFKVLVEGRNRPAPPENTFITHASSFHEALHDLSKKMQLEADTKIPYLNAGQSWDGFNIEKA